MAKLYIDEEGKTSVYEILYDEVTIGRGAANALQVRDVRADKHHAVIRRVQGRLKLIDLESRNGTRVNGAYANQCWLGQGDTLTIGAAVLRLDLEGEGVAPAESAAAAPTVPAVPVPPAPAAVPAVPARPVPPATSVLPAPPAPPAQPAAPAAPAATPTPAPARKRAAPTRAAPTRGAAARKGAAPTRGAARERYRDDQDYYDEDEEEPRFRRKKGMEPAVMWLIGGATVVVFILLMFLLMGSSLTHNKEVWLKINEMAENLEYAAAIRYAERNGDPGGEDWTRLRDRVQELREIISNIEKGKRDEEAKQRLHNHIGLYTRTSGFRPLEALSEDEVAVRLKQFLEEYPDTWSAAQIFHGVGEPWETFQFILRNHVAEDTDIQGLMRRAKQKVDTLMVERRFGDALKVYDSMLETQRILVAPELYKSLSDAVDRAMRDVNQTAAESYNEAIGRVRSAARAGKKRAARAQLQRIIDTFGIKEYVEKAEDELRNL